MTNNIESLPKVGTYPFTAYPFRCDLNGKLFPGNLGNMMLNAADFHSHDRGFGIGYLNEHNLTWVLSRFVVEMERMPSTYEDFTISTWMERTMRFFTSRNFRVDDPSGNSLGYGRSVWAMIDTKTRQPYDLMKVRDGEMMRWPDPDRPCPIEPCSRVKVSNDAELKATVVAQYGDIDVNGHVNSIRYLDHVLDLWSADWHREHALRRMEAVYVAEAHAGDRLTLYLDDCGDMEYHVSIRKDDGATECCRCNIIFR